MLEIGEEHFIRESNSNYTSYLWKWIVGIAFLVIIASLGMAWYSYHINKLYNISPFLRVTNREISLFLWQHPEFMRINAKQKLFYLTAFKYVDKVTINLNEVDDFVAAPPDLLFRYHAWDRFIREDFISTPILKEQFEFFLNYVSEWQPMYWRDAPVAYKQFVENLTDSSVEDLSTFPLTVLPLQVRLAFQGWHHYFFDKESINQLNPTVAQVRVFLEEHPKFSRAYWGNIIPEYLKDLSNEENIDSIIPSDQLAPFLRVALFNHSH